MSLYRRDHRIRISTYTGNFLITFFASRSLSLLIVTHPWPSSQTRYPTCVDPRVSRTRFPVHCVANEDSWGQDGRRESPPSTREGIEQRRFDARQRGRGIEIRGKKIFVPWNWTWDALIRPDRACSTPTWQEAIQCKSRADTSGPRVAARLRSGTSLIRVRACNGRPFIRPHECNTAGKPVSRFLLRFCLFRPPPTPSYSWTRPRIREITYSCFKQRTCVCVCKFGFVCGGHVGGLGIRRYWSADSTVCISPWSTRSGSPWIGRKFFVSTRIFYSNYID